MERAQSDESGQRCGGSVPILGARHEHKCRLGDTRVRAALAIMLKTKKATANAVRVRPREERQRRVSNPLTFSRLTPRLKPSANQQRLDGTKTVQ
jgi:hypothetical protein